MAPPIQNGRAGAFAIRAGLPNQQRPMRDISWDHTGSEPRSGDSREASEEAESDSANGHHVGQGRTFQTSQDDASQISQDNALQVSKDNEVPLIYDDDIIHPLREIANRVGRGVERFAEIFDGYNPLKAADDGEMYDMALELIDSYYNIATETADTLRQQHASARRKKDGATWRNKMRGFRITQEIDDEMPDVDDEPEASSVQMDGTTIEDLQRWEEEARTWDLLRRVAQFQYTPPGPDTSKQTPTHKAHDFCSERQVYKAFLAAEPRALERATIVKWLQETADETGEEIDTLVKDLQQNADRGDLIAHGWLHTKAAIKNQKRIHVWPYAIDASSAEVQRVLLNASKTEPLVTQLDPDAPIRQARKLEMQDEYFERSIWLGCFELLRRGKGPEEIKEWCEDRTEVWRAVSMSGLVEDKEDEGQVELRPVTRESTTLWRRMCFANARRDGADEYQKAVYGLLCGDLPSVIPVCYTWNDRMFAHFNSILKGQYEAYLLAHYPSRSPQEITAAFKIHEFGGDDDELRVKSVVNTLKLEKGLAEEALEPMKIIQGTLLANMFSTFICRQGASLAKVASTTELAQLMPLADSGTDIGEPNQYISKDDHDSMRIITHLYLIYKALGLTFIDPDDESAADNVVIAYIDFLRLAGMEELIPLYAAQLAEDRCYAVLSKTMIDVVDPDQRLVQIKLMKELGLDVQRFVVDQTENLLRALHEEGDDSSAASEFKLMTSDQDSVIKIKSNFVLGPVARSDALLVNSLEWYLLVDGLWTATLETGTLLYKHFYKTARLSAARYLSQVLPINNICISKSAIILGDEHTITDLEHEEELDDLVDEAEMEMAMQTKLMKRHMLATAKSYRELEELILAMEALRDAAYHLQMVQESESSRMRRDYKFGLHTVLSQLRQHMGQILQPKWLKFSQKEEPDFPFIRESYLPEIILGFNHILRLSGLILSRDHLLECINLATIVAEEDNDLQDLFVKKALIRELVETIADDSTALLEATGPGKGKGNTNKKVKSLGWTRDIWAIKV